MNTAKINQWMLSSLFFALGLLKVLYLMRAGNVAAEQFTRVLGLPLWLSYYSYAAVIVELSLAVGIWVRQVVPVVLLLGCGLVGFGVTLSIFSMYYKYTSDCGCGLLGENELGLLIQKLIILAMLGYAWRTKDQLISQ